MEKESDLIEALGMADLDDDGEGQEATTEEFDNVVASSSNSNTNQQQQQAAVAGDLSDLRGVKQPQQQQTAASPKQQQKKKSRAAAKLTGGNNLNDDSEAELDNLAELVPDIKQRKRMSSDENVAGDAALLKEVADEERRIGKNNNNGGGGGNDGTAHQRKLSMHSAADSLKNDVLIDTSRVTNPSKDDADDDDGGDDETSLKVQESRDFDESAAGRLSAGGALQQDPPPPPPPGAAGRKEAAAGGGSAGGVAGNDKNDGADSLDDYPDSDLVIEDAGHEVVEPEKDVPKQFMNMTMNQNISSAQSISTATQTHEVRMPMYLPTFKPATGCTNASDFIVRCFVARLRSGITVVKHGRSRWCKSRLRVLHIHPDGRSLSWKPAEGEPASSRRPPKLDLSTCLEVRHAWSPDPQNPMYTGTQILRQKCEAANAHKSFALIFKTRTVDITAVTADQCKVLMEGFSALCFRLQVANLAGGRGGAANKKGQARPMPEEDGISTTASATLTNTSTPRGRS